jgi:nucleoside-diphosphate-sugar epimerase
VIRRLLAGEPCPLSPGTQVRDFLHVQDVARALRAIARSDLEGPVNIGSSQPVTVADLARRAAELAGRPDLLRVGALPMPEGDPAFICASTGRLRSIGWAPEYTLQSGLEATVAWWREQIMTSA